MTHLATNILESSDGETARDVTGRRWFGRESGESPLGGKQDCSLTPIRKRSVAAIATLIYSHWVEERTFRIPLGTSTELEVTEVGIKSRKDGVLEYELEDGSIIRIAIAPTQILRVKGGYDADGNPTYLVKHGTVINTISAPERLRKN